MESTLQVKPLNDVFAKIDFWRQHLNQRVLGQANLIDRLLIAVLCNGHLLIEGAPGLAKTKVIRELAAGLDAPFKRIQFTPDLLPGDITGTDIYRPEKCSFEFQSGPIFNNFILADEINRAPAKVQSALLEAMEERQVSIGNHTYKLPDLFLVMATQNPIEQEGTYPLPEAELDRFLLYVKIDYPAAMYESQIVELARAEALQKIPQSSANMQAISQTNIFAARDQILNLHMSPALMQYLVELILATRTPERYGQDLKQWIRHGASPRATIALDRVARAYAWLHKRDYVTPDDIQSVVHDVLRHRIILSYTAMAEGLSTDDVVRAIVSRVAIP
ncbi:MAG: AAA family ATPase [Gammaproteobacteria bacterium]